MNITIAGIGKIERRYYVNNHVRFFADILVEAGHTVKLVNDGIGGYTSFSYSLNGKDFMVVNFSDFLNGSHDSVSFHHNGLIGYPFTPIIERFKGTDARSGRKGIVFRCREYGNGRVRRAEAGKAIRDIASCGFVDKARFIHDSFNSLAGVFIPGACNNMLDRGQISFMLSGCCTISPYIPENLPGIGRLVAGEDYVIVNDDLSNLREVVEYCLRNSSMCIEIGRQAQAKMSKICSTSFLSSYLIDIYGCYGLIFNYYEH